jgi:hypothetical protein
LLITRKQETKPENHHRLTTHPRILRKQNHKQQLLLLLQSDKKNSTKLCDNDKTLQQQILAHWQGLKDTTATTTSTTPCSDWSGKRIGEEEEKKDKWEKGRSCSDWNE